MPNQTILTCWLCRNDHIVSNRAILKDALVNVKVDIVKEKALFQLSSKQSLYKQLLINQFLQG